MVYTEKSVKKLSDKEAVQKRPGQFIGSVDIDGILTCVREILDNSVDEFMSGYGKNIKVKILKTGEIEVEDEGRGIPGENNNGISCIELALANLNAGGKFEDGAYATSGGLHGVGASAVNFLSESFYVCSKRNNGTWEGLWKNGKKVELKQISKAKNKKTGTTIKFKLNKEIFIDSETIIPPKENIIELLEERAYLNSGIIFHLKYFSEPEIKINFPGGISQMLENLIKKQKAESLISKTIFLESTINDIPVSIALLWKDTSTENIIGFCNSIRQPFGGSHITGFKISLPKVIKDLVNEFNLLKKNKDIEIDSRDCFENCMAVVSIKHSNPVYRGQAKGSLSNNDVQGAVQKIIYDLLPVWFKKNSKDAKIIANFVANNAYERFLALQAKKQIKKVGKGLSGMNKPHKLKDCSSKIIEEREMFICEGECLPS